jgi:hypothetical protein
MHNYDNPSMRPVDYYYDDSVYVTIPAKKENFKNEMIRMSTPCKNNNHKNDDDDNNKGSRDKMFVMLTHMCIFSIFVSAVVIIMTMN